MKISNSLTLRAKRATVAIQMKTQFEFLVTLFKAVNSRLNCKITTFVLQHLCFALFKLN